MLFSRDGLRGKGCQNSRRGAKGEFALLCLSTASGTENREMGSIQSIYAEEDKMNAEEDKNFAEKDNV